MCVCRYYDEAKAKEPLTAAVDGHLTPAMVQSRDFDTFARSPQNPLEHH